jgi:tetratricopeptide (TPR) repeat protein
MDADRKEYLQTLAEDCLREKRYDDAILLYRRLVDANPAEESSLLALAWAYYDGGMCKNAVDCFECLLDMELGRKVFTGFAFDELVRILKEAGDYERLIKICEKVVMLQPEDIGLLGDLGDAYLRAGKYNSAVEVFEKMAAIEPDASVIFCRLGNALIAKGDITGTEEAYRKAVEIDPSEKGTFYYRLADAYMEAGYLDGAEKALRICIEYMANEPAYYCRLGEVLILRGRLDDAEIAYEMAVHLNQDNAGAFYNRLGSALEKAGSPLRAIEIFKRAIAADPKNPFYPLRLAGAYTAAGLSDKTGKT